MTDRGGVLGLCGVVCVGGGTLALAFTDASGPLHVLFLVFLSVAVLAFVPLLLALLQEVAAWRLRLKRRGSARSFGVGQQGQAAAGMWRQASSAEFRVLAGLQDVSMRHPGYAHRVAKSDNPPLVRIGVLVSCASLDNASPATSALRASFRRFLARGPVADAVMALTGTAAGLEWRPWDDRGPVSFGAVLTGDRQADAPVAWARLNLPEIGTTQVVGDPRCAEFVLQVEPRGPGGTPAAASTLPVWHRRLTRLLELPAALADFLARDLRLATRNDPPPEFAIWLTAPHSITEIVDPAGCAVVPGSIPRPSFAGYAVADPQGQPAGAVAIHLLRRLCDYALHLDNYEDVLGGVAVTATQVATASQHRQHTPADQRQAKPARRTVKPARRTLRWRITLGVIATPVIIVVALILTSSSAPASPPNHPEHVFFDGRGTEGVDSIAFEQNGELLAIGDLNDDIYLQNLVTHSVRLLINQDSSGVSSVAFSPGTGILAAGDEDDSTYVWDTARNKIVGSLPDGDSNGWVASVAYSPHGSVLAAGDGDNDKVYLWNTAADTLITTLPDPPGPNTGGVNAVAFSPDGTAIAAGDTYGATYLWRPAIGRLHPASTFQDPGSNLVNTVAFSPSGSLLATGDGRGAVVLWDLNTGKVRRVLHDPSSKGVNAVAFSHGGTAIAAGDQNGRVYIWRLANGKLEKTFYVLRDKAVSALAFSPDGGTLAVGDANGRTYLWDMSWLRS